MLAMIINLGMHTATLNVQQTLTSYLLSVARTARKGTEHFALWNTLIAVFTPPTMITVRGARERTETMIRIEDYDTALVAASKLTADSHEAFLRELAGYLDVFLQARRMEREMKCEREFKGVDGYEE